MKKLEIYTDGSCLKNPGFGGYSFIIVYQGNEKIGFGSSLHTTNNRMETKAVIKAIKMLKEPCEIDLYTDSALVMKSITLWLSKWVKNDFKGKANADLWKSYLEVAKPHKIRVHHVKAHNGHEYNERCDAYAKAAALRCKMEKKVNSGCIQLSTKDLQNTHPYEKIESLLGIKAKKMQKKKLDLHDTLSHDAADLGVKIKDAKNSKNASKPSHQSLHEHKAQQQHLFELARSGEGGFKNASLDGNKLVDNASDDALAKLCEASVGDMANTFTHNSNDDTLVKAANLKGGEAGFISKGYAEIRDKDTTLAGKEAKLTADELKKDGGLNTASTGTNLANKGDTPPKTKAKTPTKNTPQSTQIHGQYAPHTHEQNSTHSNILDSISELLLKNTKNHPSFKHKSSKHHHGDYPDLNILYKKIDYTFKNEEACLQALTHKSSRERPSNERLEFLGDAVFDLCVGDYLYFTYPHFQEGSLSKLRASLVSERGLALIADKIGLGPYLFMSAAEEENGGRTKPSLLSNALEAVLGAIYLEAGLARAKKTAIFLLENSYEVIDPQNLYVDYKTQLQELTQGRMGVIPSYALISSSGPDHQKLFEVAVEVNGKELSRAKAKSKKEAQRLAARDAIKILSS